MHFALLLGFGASAMNPYLAIETLEDLAQRASAESLNAEGATRHFIKAINKGLLKTFSKMASRRSKAIAERRSSSDRLNKDLVDAYFAGTTSRLEGIGLDVRLGKRR